MAEFWNELITEKSWEKLQELAKEFDLVVIGGWAVYLWAKQHKSKDIDVIVDLATLQKLKSRFQVEKNNRLKKYEVKFGQFDADIYAAHHSQLELPVEELLARYIAQVEGIKTITPEALLILKQGAELNRKHSVKGKKDAIDIVSLLIYSVDLQEYLKILKRHKKMQWLQELQRVLTEFDNKDCSYVGKNFKQFSDWKKKMLNEIRKIK